MLGVMLWMACSSGETPAQSHLSPRRESPVDAAVLARICAAPCAGPMARLRVWRDNTEAVKLVEFEGDLEQCSHPPVAWFDPVGTQVAAYGTNPGASPPKISREERVKGLHQTAVLFCP